MKTAVFGFVCLLACVLAQDTPCKTGSDCGEGECCLSTAMFDGKRQVGAFCKPRGDLGDGCYVNNDAFLGQEDSTMYYNGCPCLSGQECEGMGIFEVPQGEHGKCVAATKDKRQVTSCNSVDDCASNECCIANEQPIGKKRQALARGYCRALGAEGDGCLVGITSVGTMNYACPCEAGLTCEGENVFVVPLGEGGKCTA